MMIRFRTRIPFQNRKDPLHVILNPERIPKRILQTLKMVGIPPTSKGKRPVCSSCSKPTRICLCSRFQNPRLENSVNVIILQHSKEKKHPLNSVRIVKLGLKNVKIISVSDVISEARFTIRLLEPNPNHNDAIQEQDPRSAKDDEGGGTITATIRKHETCHQIVNKVDEILKPPSIRSSLEKGFIVKKFQKGELEEIEEFEIEIPPKSVLLFPSENAFCVDDSDAIEFEFHNLIVLDGTWAKAKRMYHGNFWLRFLPHMKLDLDKISLYSEVRIQPKIGFLSTIESIVYALKVIGDYPEGLDGLLDVFESMVVDQRRCKDERLKSLCEEEKNSK